MARTATLLALRTAVRQRAFLESSTAVVTDSEINEYINQSWAEIHDELVITVQDYALTKSTISTIVGTDTYPLPADFYKFRTLIVTLGGFDVEMREFRLEEIEVYQYQGGWFVDTPIAYHRAGENVLFKPTPTTAGQIVTVWYISAAPRMVSDSDTIDGQNGWEEFAVLDAACKCLDKLDRDCSRLERQRELLRARIVKMAASTNYSEPGRVIRRRSRYIPLRGWR